jgi:hypothetical protein
MSETENKPVARAEQFVREAFRVFVQSCNPQDPLAWRAQLAIRHFAGLFYEQAAAYGLPADLKITLDLICQGLEDKIPDDLCGIWAQGESDHDYEPWVLPDFRTLLRRGDGRSSPG